LPAGSVKANMREPAIGLGRVFNIKLGCFDDVCVLIYEDAWKLGPGLVLLA
jgi:hypothetical protein